MRCCDRVLRTARNQLREVARGSGSGSTGSVPAAPWPFCRMGEIPTPLGTDDAFGVGTSCHTLGDVALFAFINARGCEWNERA